MAARSPARFLAPIALVAFAFALYTVVQDARDSTGGGSSSSSPAQTSPEKGGGKKKSTAAKKRTKPKRRTYVVKAGDTPSGIAAKTGVPLTTLQELNPNLDPQALTVGQRLKLRR